VSENTVLRRVLGSKCKEVKGGWRKLHNEVVKERRMRMDRACSMYRRDDKTCKL
jgi:hypothetical protein